MRLTVFLLLLFAAPDSVRAITIETIPIGNSGNAPDPQNLVPSGAVDYDFDLGKYEVTNAQYVAFLNGVDPAGTNSLNLYTSQMMSDALGGINFTSGALSGAKYSAKAGRASNPVVFVSFFDAARFTNWLHNGQGATGTESGAYVLTGGTAFPLNADFVARSAVATWCLPTSDEWYKAAFHKNDGVTGNYFDYPTGSDPAPAAAAPPGNSNSANFMSVVGGLTNVGAYPSSISPYGTFDQGGNVWEWTENSSTLEARRVAGGSWINAATFLSSSANNNAVATTEAYTVGFRVARVVPQVVPGDYNVDGNVDAADYTIWRNTLGSMSDLRANGDDSGASMGVIDAADYTVWKTNYGQPVGGAAAIAAAQSVPEPATLIILLTSAIALLPYRLRVKPPVAV